MNKSGYINIFIILITLTVVIVVLLFMRGLKTEENGQLQTPDTSLAPTYAPYIDTSEYDIKFNKCDGVKYSDNDLNFSIDCPLSMNIYTILKRQTFYNLTEKIMFICESQVELNDNKIPSCKDGSIRIWANGDGWGGGCDEEFRTNILISKVEENICIGDNWFNHLYLGDVYYTSKSNRFYINGNFSDSFSKNDAVSILRSFEISP